MDVTWIWIGAAADKPPRSPVMFLEAWMGTDSDVNALPTAASNEAAILHFL